MNIKIGVVENNIDTEKLGRVQVRIFGHHTEDRTEYPTDDLPWAQCLSSSPNISGEGNFFLPNNGDWVAVSFFDPEEQYPAILGVIPKFVESLPDFASGFSDPNSENPDSNFVGESGISRLARNENISDTIIQDKKDDRTTGVQCNGVSWDEPETPYDAEYPNNKVIHTKGHVIELDDTDSKERVHIFHKSGTSTEIHPNGNKVDLIKSNRYVVIDSDNNILTKGDWNIRIEGDENLEIVGDRKEKVDNITEDVGTNKTENIGGNSTENVDGSKTIDASSVSIDSSGTSELKGTTVTIEGSAAVNITSSGAVTISGSPISLN
jgi:hypothetical protein